MRRAISSRERDRRGADVEHGRGLGRNDVARGARPDLGRLQGDGAEVLVRRAEVDLFQGHEVAGEQPRRVGGAEGGGVGGVAGIAARHQLQDHEALLRHGQVEAGRLADDGRLQRQAAARQLGENGLRCRSPWSLRPRPGPGRG